MQSACIDQVVSDGANAILIAANSADGVNESLKKAAEAGCKIVYVDSAASYDCVTALATDNEKAGQTMGHDGLTIAIQALEGQYTDTNTKMDTGVAVITKESM